jgi:sec-independent protein translocase protein TatC
VAFCHFFVFGVVFQFINNFAPTSISVAPDIENYFSSVLTTFLTFGLTFEVPVAMALLVKMKVVTIEKLREIRPYSVVAAFVILAVVTPPDVVSQLMLAIPLCALYEIGLLVAPSFLKFGSTTIEGLNV